MFVSFLEGWLGVGDTALISVPSYLSQGTMYLCSAMHRTLQTLNGCVGNCMGWLWVVHSHVEMQFATLMFRFGIGSQLVAPLAAKGQ